MEKRQSTKEDYKLIPNLQYGESVDVSASLYG